MSKKENRKEKKTKLILEKAIVVIAEKGYHAATVSDFAKDAGVSAGSIYNHFDNKEHILIQILQDFLIYLSAVNLIK